MGGGNCFVMLVMESFCSQNIENILEEVTVGNTSLILVGEAPEWDLSRKSSSTVHRAT
jgi:hypothetical protein